MASAKLAALFTSFKECIKTLCDPNRTPRAKASHVSEMPPHEAQEDMEKQKLRKVIESLKAKLGEYKSLANVVMETVFNPTTGIQSRR